MPALTLREAYQAWGDIIDSYLREATDDDIAKLMPVDHPIDIEKMTVGEYLDFKKNLWRSSQARNIIGLLRKETAYARRNEHHQITKLFTADEIKNLSPETVKRLKERFAELNETVKGKF